MGIYADIQTDLIEAFADDLSDAVTAFILFYRDPQDGAYSVATGDFIQDSDHFFPTNVAGVAYTDGTCRGVLSDLDEDDEVDNVEFNHKVHRLMVLDSEIISHKFDFDNKRYFVEVGTLDSAKIRHRIRKDKVDPAGATHSFLIEEVEE